MSDQFLQTNMESNDDSKISSESLTTHEIGGQDFSFAILADSHIDPNVPERSQYLKDIYEYLTLQRQPHFILHLGDMTECGLPHEYKEFEALIPSTFREHLHVIPGNHEVRWDEWAGEKYKQLFGTTPYSFDIRGVHFIALDPTEPLREPGYFTQEDLTWLSKNLSALKPETPVIIYLHYPIGEHHYFICNEDKFLEVIEGYNVRAVFSGHVHEENKWEQNGATFFSLPAIKNGPFFFWGEKKNDGKGVPILSIFSGEIKEKLQEPNLRLFAEIPLQGDRPAALERPHSIVVQPKKTDASLTVGLDQGSKAISVLYQFWPEYTWAGKADGNWKKLYSSKDEEYPLEWKTDIAMNEMPAGVYRLQVRVVNTRRQYWDEFLKIIVPEHGTANRLEKLLDLEEPIQAGLEIVNESPGAPPLVVAATTNGQVLASTLEGKVLWTFHAGALILGTPQYAHSDNLIIFGTKNHRVYALNPSNGQEIWSYKANGAVLATLVIDYSQIIVCAGRHVLSLKIESGLQNWATEIGGFSAGMPAVDGRALYLGAGDGHIYSLDKTTGSILWKKALDLRDRPFSTLIYSPWGTKAVIVPNNHDNPPIVLVSTVAAAYGLNRHSGEIIWTCKVSNPYSAPLIHALEETRAILMNEWGNIASIDPYSGEIFWETTVPQRIFNTSPIASGDLVYITGVNGLLMGLDLSTGHIVDQHHFSTDCVYSTPVLYGNRLFLAGQDGSIQSITLKRA
ncbi:outer membrane protein assembly factor BamB family protein [Bacillus sp. SD088]|uniref:outer membrane protein assembly factor BamB family protein n=1 Tax=Bacillus sp. SD088 TaxID=2782012 RepID=UPI001A95C962|nr:PQQ-binding-like beta-propeller repeat protein [Bacillus sp. SD088]MBO0991958.1 PQQ-binding-like beta-propeller repeat protein [Bacillus sp. SD088]